MRLDQKLTFSPPSLRVGPGLEVELALVDELVGLRRIHTIVLGILFILLVADQIICATVDRRIDLLLSFCFNVPLIILTSTLISMLRLFVVLNRGMNFSFGRNAYGDFWYVGGTAEEIGLSDSKRVSEIILSKGFTAAIGTILERS